MHRGRTVAQKLQVGCVAALSVFLTHAEGIKATTGFSNVAIIIVPIICSNGTQEQVGESSKGTQEKARYLTIHIFRLKHKKIENASICLEQNTIKH